jgi:TPR repeat protein
MQAALRSCSEVAARWTTFRREVTAGIAVLMLVVGFLLGVYRDTIVQSFAGLSHAIGFTRPPPTVDTAYTAYQNGDYAKVLRLARPLATEGDARAQSLLGLVYYRGRGAPQDHGEAVKLFRSAADQGDAPAQFYLGFMYSEGQGVPQDYAEAVRWFRLAAERGEAQAQYNLGLSYAKGETGEGDPDNVNAYMWFNIATASFAATDPRRSTAMTSRDAVAHKMTPEEIAEAQKRAREWRRR